MEIRGEEREDGKIITADAAEEGEGVLELGSRVPTFSRGAESGEGVAHGGGPKLVGPGRVKGRLGRSSNWVSEPVHESTGDGLGKSDGVSSKLRGGELAMLASKDGVVPDASTGFANGGNQTGVGGPKTSGFGNGASIGTLRGDGDGSAKVQLSPHARHGDPEGRVRGAGVRWVLHESP